MDNAHDLVALSTEAGALARALQAERVTATVELTRNGSTTDTAFDKQVARTDAVIARFRQHRTAASTLRRVEAGLNALTNVREQVRSSARASLTAIVFSYRILIADLLAFRDSVATDASTYLADDIRAAAAVSQAGEAVGQLQIIVLRSLVGGELTAQAQQESAGAQARYAEAATTFLDLAGQSWVTRWERIGTAPEVVVAQRLQDEVGRTLTGNRLVLDADSWINATNGWIDQIFSLQRDVDATVAAKVQAERRQRLRDAVLQGGAMLLVLILTAVVTGLVARRITRRLRSLRATVTTVAYDRLPAVVHELASAPPGTVRPQELADRSVSEYTISGTDEIADVAAAVRSLHRETVRIAGEQAVMRASVAEIFVHLSRREQRLVDAILAQVDQVERNELDADRLQQLYRLDHLATRMARINQSLLVLGGSGVSRVRQEAVPLNNVIQAALSQIEQYTRVRIGAVDKELLVAGDAVDEVVHLLAELLDNATAYSPPETDVWVSAHALSDRVIVQVVDEGVGLSPQRYAEYNARLATPAAIDVVGVRAMGLTVVAMLAARHRVRVELRAGTSRGTIADVSLPEPLLSREPVERLELAGLAEATTTGALPPAPLVSAGARHEPAPSRSTGSQPAAGAAAPLFRPTVPETVARMEPPARRTVNGWFKTAMDGDSTIVVWPSEVPSAAGQPPDSGPAGHTSDSGPEEVPAAATATGETATAVSTAVGLPRRTPQRHLAPGLTSERPRSGASTPRRVDPSAVAAAMSAYAKGVAGRRANTPSEPPPP